MKEIIIIILVGLLTACFVYGVYSQFFHKKPQEMKEYIKVPEIKEVVKIKRIKVPIKEVITIEKQVVAEKLKLPDEIAKDENKQVIATGTITHYKGQTDVVAVLDTKTGESELVAKQRPLPFIKPEMLLSLYGEMKIWGSDYAPIARIGLQLDVLRIHRNTVIYTKVETGMMKKEIVNDYRPYGAVYTGIRHEMELLK